MLDGGGEADTMKGGLGNDTYRVDHWHDAVVETAGEGVDTVETSTSFWLSDNVENLLFTYEGYGELYGNEAANRVESRSNWSGVYLNGNGGNDVIIGGGAGDTIIGGSGDDMLTGGGGNDIFVFDWNSGQDTITDFGTGGHDVLDFSRFGNWRPVATPFGADVVISVHTSKIVLTNTAISALSVPGVFDGTIAGPTVAAPPPVPPSPTQSEFVGDGAANSLTGTSRNDVLDGRGGADTMTGGLGDDLYRVDHWNDVFIERSAGGTDTIETIASYWLPDHVENLVFTHEGTAELYGNEVANRIESRSDWSGVYLNGHGGNDVIIGGGAADTIVGGTGDDVLTGGNGADTFFFDWNSGHDSITDFGKGGKDVLDFSSFGDWKPTATQMGDDVLVSIYTTQVILADIRINQLITTDAGYMFGG